MKTKNILIGGAAAAAIYYLYSKKSAAPTTTVVAPAVINPSTGTGTAATSTGGYVPITIDTNSLSIPRPKIVFSEAAALGAMAPRLVITDAAKMQSWNCINNPTAPGCNVQKVSWNCQKNPNAPGCNPSRNAVYNSQAILLKAQAAETLR